LKETRRKNDALEIEVDDGIVKKLLFLETLVVVDVDLDGRCLATTQVCRPRLVSEHPERRKRKGGE
jgi:hypothetical protein